MIVLTRIDNRLIHGQVIEAWLPHLSIRRLVVADDAAADDLLAKTAMKLAVPSSVEVRLQHIGDIDFAALARDEVRTLVLLREVSSAVAAYQKGLPPGSLNLGNVHAGPLRKPISRSVFLSDGERDQLASLQRSGMAVSVQSVPTEAPMPLPS